MNNSKKRSWKGVAKKGLIFCIIGVMALSMVACGGKDKKTDSKEPKTQTEQSTDKKTKKNSTKKNSIVQKPNKSGSTTKEKKNN